MFVKRKPSINYVNNADFYNRLVEWKKSGDKKIPDDIAKTLVMICEHLAESGKFAGYTWRDEMVCDAILSCIKFCGNFDPEKSKNDRRFRPRRAGCRNGTVQMAQPRPLRGNLGDLPAAELPVRQALANH